jgi:hypothetical protein
MKVQDNLIFNMSAPPRSSIAVARGRKRKAALSVDLNFMLPPPGPRFTLALCEKLGLGSVTSITSIDQAVSLLSRATEEALDALALPQVLVITIPTKQAAPRDPLLAVALLSRSSGRMFLRTRTPAFTHERLGNTSAGFMHQAILEVL